MMMFTGLLHQDSKPQFDQQQHRSSRGPFAVLEINTIGGYGTLHFNDLDTLDLFIAAATSARRELAAALKTEPEPEPEPVAVGEAPW